MNLFDDIVNTSAIPETLFILKQHLPSILMAQCFNDEEIPFAIEVQKTELGHLFEHILLEYLCKLKLANGSTEASFSGRTYWNWKKDPRGTFHIVIRTGYANAAIFPLALEQTIQLMKILLHSIQLSVSIPIPQVAPQVILQTRAD